MAKKFEIEVTDRATGNSVKVRVHADDKDIAEAIVNAAARRFFEGIKTIKLSAADPSP
jgi:capsular polysaccharide biosynthesis protein